MTEMPLEEYLAKLEEREKLDAELKAAAGPTLQAARNAAGLTQSDLAAQLGTTRAHVAQLETGWRTPSPGTANAIYSVLNGAQGGTTSAKDQAQAHSKQARKGKQAR